MKEPIQVLYYFSVELHALRNFASIAERIWQEEFSKYEEFLESDDIELMLRFDFRTDLSASLTDLFPQLQRRSLILSIFSMFEEHLNSLSESIASKNNITIKFSDMNGTGIERSKLYLKKVVGLGRQQKISYPPIPLVSVLAGGTPALPGPAVP